MKKKRETGMKGEKDGDDIAAGGGKKKKKQDWRIQQGLVPGWRKREAKTGGSGEGEK